MFGGEHGLKITVAYSLVLTQEFHWMYTASDGQYGHFVNALHSKSYKICEECSITLERWNHDTFEILQ